MDEELVVDELVSTVAVVLGGTVEDVVTLVLFTLEVVVLVVWVVGAVEVAVVLSEVVLVVVVMPDEDHENVVVLKMTGPRAPQVAFKV